MPAAAVPRPRSFASLCLLPCTQCRGDVPPLHPKTPRSRQEDHSHSAVPLRPRRSPLKSLPTYACPRTPEENVPRIRDFVDALHAPDVRATAAALGASKGRPPIETTATSSRMTMRRGHCPAASTMFHFSVLWCPPALPPISLSTKPARTVGYSASNAQCPPQCILQGMHVASAGATRRGDATWGSDAAVMSSGTSIPLSPANDLSQWQHAGHRLYDTRPPPPAPNNKTPPSLSPGVRQKIPNKRERSIPFPFSLPFTRGFSVEFVRSTANFGGTHTQADGDCQPTLCAVLIHQTWW